MSINRVAKLAKVSTATVSRVMNGHEAVSPENVRKVKEAMKQLKYTPRAIRPGPKVQSLPRNRANLRTGSLALVLAGRTSDLLQIPHIARLTRSMTSAANEQGLGLMTLEMRSPVELPRPLRDRAVDGVMLLSWPEDVQPWLDALVPLPVVLCGGEPPVAPPTDIVCVNNAVITRLAVEYLISQGCSRLAFLNHLPAHPALAARRREFKRHTTILGVEAGIFESEPPFGDIEEALWKPDRLSQGMGAALEAALASNPRPDGLFIPTDQQMSTVHALLRARGIQPGKDIRLVGCDNNAPWLSNLHPRPASVDPGVEQEGREAVRRILARIEHPYDDPVTVMSTPRMVFGE